VNSRALFAAHRVHLGIEQIVYHSAETVVCFIRFILLFKLLPTNAARSLSSDANMNENPEKGLEVMDGIMEDIVVMSMKVPLR
jgi:hypothetical protein